MTRRKTTTVPAADAGHPGAAYVALTRLTLKDGTVVAAIGETCERVPEVSIVSLAARGKIRRVENGGADGQA